MFTYTEWEQPLWIYEKDRCFCFQHEKWMAEVQGELISDKMGFQYTVVYLFSHAEVLSISWFGNCQLASSQELMYLMLGCYICRKCNSFHFLSIFPVIRLCWAMWNCCGRANHQKTFKSSAYLITVFGGLCSDISGQGGEFMSVAPIPFPCPSVAMDMLCFRATPLCMMASYSVAKKGRHLHKTPVFLHHKI